MKETIHLLAMFALLLGLIVGGTKFFKNRHSYNLAPTDASMNPGEFPSGSYKLDVRSTDVSKFKDGDVIVYRQPNESAIELIGRVVAIEGQTIACGKPQGLMVDGKATAFNGDTNRRIPEFRVPRGCVYVLIDNPLNGTDSVTLGPIPQSFVRGRIVR